MNQIRNPDVLNVLKQGKFKLNIYAYRRLNRAELILAAGEYMRANKIRSLPKSGEGTVISGIGFDGF